MAVVIGRGPSDWDAVTRDGKLDTSVAEVLGASYVCVYVDTTTDRGRMLADAFEMKSGLVLSDRTGEKQAFRHEGTLSNGDLARVLQRYSAPDRVVTRTETHAQTEIRYYPYESPAPAVAAPSYFVPVRGGYCGG